MCAYVYALLTQMSKKKEMSVNSSPKECVCVDKFRMSSIESSLR